MTGRPVAEVTGREPASTKPVTPAGFGHRAGAGSASSLIKLMRLMCWAKVGGLEIAGLAGLMVGAAAARVPVVLDGFIAGAAA